MLLVVFVQEVSYEIQIKRLDYSLSFIVPVAKNNDLHWVNQSSLHLKGDQLFWKELKFRLNVWLDHWVHFFIEHLSHSWLVLEHSVKILFVVSPHDPKCLPFKQISIFSCLWVVPSFELEVLVSLHEATMKLVGYFKLRNRFCVWSCWVISFIIRSSFQNDFLNWLSFSEFSFLNEFRFLFGNTKNLGISMNQHWFTRKKVFRSRFWSFKSLEVLQIKTKFFSSDHFQNWFLLVLSDQKGIFCILDLCIFKFRIYIITGKWCFVRSFIKK